MHHEQLNRERLEEVIGRVVRPQAANTVEQPSDPPPGQQPRNQAIAGDNSTVTILDRVTFNTVPPHQPQPTHRQQRQQRQQRLGVPAWGMFFGVMVGLALNVWLTTTWGQGLGGARFNGTPVDLFITVGVSGVIGIAAALTARAAWRKRRGP